MDVLLDILLCVKPFIFYDSIPLYKGHAQNASLSKTCDFFSELVSPFTLIFFKLYHQSAEKCQQRQESTNQA